MTGPCRRRGAARLGLARRPLAAAALACALVPAGSGVGGGVGAGVPGPSLPDAAPGKAGTAAAGPPAAPAAAASAAVVGLPELDVMRLARAIHPRREGGTSVWEYELVVRDGQLRLADGTLYNVWAFGSQVPGPTLLAREGDRVRIRLTNETSTPHSLHSHGLYVPQRMDGVPHALDLPGHEMPDMAGMPGMAPVGPGESYVYDYIARPAGTHFYHCHVNSNEHLARGMAGALIVLPRRPDPPVDKDLVLILGELDSRFAASGVPGNPRQAGDADFFTINGRSFPETGTIRAELGEVIRLRLINAGAQLHAMHLHGQSFLMTHKDGRPLAEPQEMDTVGIAPGERVDLLVVANNPGLWCFHCHMPSHVTNRGHYPGGMLLHLQIGAAAFPQGGDGPAGPGIGEVRARWRRHARQLLASGGGSSR